MKKNFTAKLHFFIERPKIQRIKLRDTVADRQDTVNNIQKQVPVPPAKLKRRQKGAGQKQLTTGSSIPDRPGMLLPTAGNTIPDRSGTRFPTAGRHAGRLSSQSPRAESLEETSGLNRSFPAGLHDIISGTVAQPAAQSAPDVAREVLHRIEQRVAALGVIVLKGLPIPVAG